ncbi:Mpt5p [Lachancea thermotolerans CBS 6340]|uniref:KLTH0E06864p n=1 Tax=Lachancea thermotolerans (strain ATCC 56472 / CBS 6340 / NRRL Y-8284) TaxID=559295 RepID=C5DHT0_LACTC|nr:KLTH0E06864p [Lachancea thermotolerans CBS 6340]CAR23341.1 KLTH0E06864p [Lachancea thermotolerans CBS 6340]
MHQPQLSINSVQSLVEPTTPPLGQMTQRQNHQRTHSLDLSGFNQFMQGNSPMMPLSLSPPTPPPPAAAAAASASASATTAGRPKLQSLPLISELDLLADGRGPRAPIPTGAPARTVSGSTTSSSASASAVRTHARSGSQPSALLLPNAGAAGAAGATGVPADLSWTPLDELDYVKVATDQFGCRFLQKKLENPQECCAVRDLMYRHIKPYFLDLILDPFGNYLIQKLCEYLTTDQKTQLVESIYPHVFQISINQYGTRSLQKVIDTVDTDAQVDLIISGFGQNFTSIEQVVVLINDLNGNHVVQKCIFKFPPSKFGFIIDAIVDNNNIVKISTHKHGCCVLQKLLSVCTLQQIFKISVKIVQFLRSLINDQFGNYIIQFLLDIKELDFYLLGEIYDKLSGELCQLSCLKFSSNVVEKFIKKLFTILKLALSAAPPARNSAVSEDVVAIAMKILLNVIDVFTVNLNILIRDNYGNYALQTLLDVKNYTKLLQYPSNTYVHTSAQTLSFSHEFTVKVGNLVVLTKEMLPSIKTTSYAKKIKLKVKAYAELTGLVFAEAPSSNKAATPGANANNHRRQHARHCSLPANAYRHRRNSSSISLSSGFPLPQPPQQQQHQPFGYANPLVNSSLFANANATQLGPHNFYSDPQRPFLYNQHPEASLPFNNSFGNAPSAAVPPNHFAYHDPRVLQMSGAQENNHNFAPTAKPLPSKPAETENLYARGGDFENVNYGNIFY